jgi:hypothetical protein
MKTKGADLPRPAGLWNLIRRRGLVLLGLMLLPLVLGGWRDITGNTINPRFVERIKNGQTTRHEILLWFGDPKETERTADGLVLKFFSYKDAPPEVSAAPRQPQEQSSQPFLLDEDKKIKKVPKKTEGKILRGTLTVRFKPDGETVMSYEYKEY